MKQFLLDNWRLILEIILVITSTIILALRKKPVVNEMDNILLKVCESLPQWINSAEVLKDPVAKKSLVLETVKDFVKKQFSVNLPDSYLILIGQIIEDILSTPQKKNKEVL